MATEPMTGWLQVRGVSVPLKLLGEEQVKGALSGSLHLEGPERRVQSHRQKGVWSLSQSWQGHHKGLSSGRGGEREREESA